MENNEKEVQEFNNDIEKAMAWHRNPTMEKQNKPLSEKDFNVIRINSELFISSKEVIEYFIKNENKHKQAVKEAYEELLINLCECNIENELRWIDCDVCKEIKRIFKDKFGFELK